MLNIALASLMTGVLSCDTVTAGQFMLSRPIIMGPVIGLCLGNPYVGFIAGICVELIWSSVIPIGSSTPPDMPMTSALATASAIFSISNYGITEFPAIILALVVSIPCGILFQKASLKIRLRNSDIIDKIKADVAKDKYESVNFFTLFAILRVFLVSAFFFAACYILITQIPRAYWMLFSILNVAPWVILRFIYILCFAQLFEMFVKWK
ncbi:MAG: PTS sugar transporter subunit IIC [bacterium]